MTQVLIVEDVEEMREMIAGLLGEATGIKVSGKAANTWEARLEIDRRRPDVVLLDELLPGESSFDLLKELDELRIGVVLMTGMEDRTGALPKGASSRIIKPDWDSFAESTPRLVSALLAAVR